MPELRIICGRAGSGKSEAIAGEIVRRARQGAGGQILIVPEYLSHDTERFLCEKGGDEISLFAEALTLKRLAPRVFCESGGLSDKYLRESGRLLIMSMALDAVRGELETRLKARKRPEHIKRLVDTMSELKACLVPPDALLRAAGKVDGELSKKLMDLYRIYCAYEGTLREDMSDPGDLLSLLLEGLERSDYLRGRDVYFDGFDEFSAQERAVVELCVKKACSCTVALPHGEGGIFEHTGRTMRSLERAAERFGVPCTVTRLENGVKRPKGLWHIERALFDYSAPPLAEECGDVAFFTAGGVYEECEQAAARILSLVYSEGYRFCDFAVAACRFEEYAPALEAVFEKYGVPLFMDGAADILSKSPVAFVLSALDAAVLGFECDDVLEYLRTGLSGVPFSDAALLENYALIWGVRGNAWLNDFTGGPRGYSREITARDAELLEKINAARKAALDPLEKLKKDLSAGPTAEGAARAIFGFMERVRLYDSLMEKSERFLDGGELKLADEYRQLFEILCEALDELAFIMADAPLEPRELPGLFRLTLSQYTVGTIPLSLDRVTAGPYTRQHGRGVRCLFVLGACDGALPSRQEPKGTLSDPERKSIIGAGIEVYPPSWENADRELFECYRLFTRPSERLFVSYARKGASGDERPSFLLSRLRAMLPLAEELAPLVPWLYSKDACFERALARDGAEASYLRQDAALAERLVSARRAIESCSEGMTGDAASSLYGGRLRLSASRVDDFSSCRFSFFMRYGMRAAPRRAARLDALESGNFTHFLLENAMREVWERGGFDRISAKERRELSKRLTQEYVTSVFQGGAGGKRLLYLTGRLRRICDRILDNIAEEFSVSGFRPIDFELSFGPGGSLPAIPVTDRVELTGKIDRVDGYVRDGKLYIRVVDYKSGLHSFSLSDIYSGIGMQLLIYLFALAKDGSARYSMETLPAGAVYMPVRDAVASGRRDEDGDELQKKLDKLLSRSGLLLDDPEVLSAMEAENRGRFIPVRLKSDGSAGARSSVASLEQLGRLSRHVDGVLKKMAGAVLSGEITPNPCSRGLGAVSCDHCDYRQACLFDARLSRPRYLPRLSRDEFFSLLPEDRA